MKTTRTFASICLTTSCVALLTAANVSGGGQSAVVRLASVGGQAGEANSGPPPAPPEGLISGQYQEMPGSVMMPDTMPPMQQGGYYPTPGEFSPYFGRSFGATDGPPIVTRKDIERPLFGPQLMFESNIDNGLGFDNAFHRLNARLPYHVVPGNTVLMGDLSASITSDGDALYNMGLVWRNYDEMRNRVFGWNGFYDFDQSGGLDTEYQRVGVGFESLGKYIDARANGYYVTGEDSTLITDQLIGDLMLRGNNAFRVRNQTRQNAYSGADFEVGGPLPLLGRRGLNMYVGAYYLGNDFGYDALGFQARWEALVTESATVNVRYTNDDTFGTNSWVSIAYTIPNYFGKRLFQPKNVQERLADPVYRSNRVHTHIDVAEVPEAAINPATGLPYFITYVDPNVSGMGSGTRENPYMTLQQAADANNAGIDVIRVSARDDDTGTKLTAVGGLTLFDDQVLLSANKEFTLFQSGGMDFVIPAEPNASGLGPLISDPNMVAGGSVVRVANNNQIIGMRIDAANAAGTVFGTGVSNPLPFEDINLFCNTFLNYSTAVDLQDASGMISVDENNFEGLAGASMNGLLLTTANGSTTELLIRNNTANNNAGTGISVTAQAGSTINADNPTAFSAVTADVKPTGVVDNVVTNGGEGIVMTAQTGATINAVVDGNTSSGNTFNGFVARADGGTWNLAALSNNTFNSNLENGAFLHYLNGGVFRAVSEDLNGDGILGAGEDLNGNGRLDEGIVSNTMNNNSLIGLCIFGQDASTGEFDIGGPVASLGNTMLGNAGAGIAVDLEDDATAQIDALFNTIQGGNADPGLTFVLDFIDPGQAPVTDVFGFTTGPFDITAYGFAPGDFDLVTNTILNTVRGHYRDVPTAGQNPGSNIPDGMELDIDFVIGDTGVAPSNGATEYYVIAIGDSPNVPLGLAGIAGNIGNVRDANGVGPNTYFNGAPQLNGGLAASTFTNQINLISPFVNPPNASTIPEPLRDFIDPNTPEYAQLALTSGNLTFTRQAIGFVTSHEIGHTVSLRHVDNTTAVTPTGQHPMMGTGAISATIQSFIEPHEFALTGVNPGELPGEAPFVQESINQLASAVGLRIAAGETRNGITVNATDNARLLPSTFNNNTIAGARDNGINIDVSGNAVAEGVTIQSNSITNGGGHGVRLAANGPNAFIDAASTIGGSGTNVLRGTSFAQGNTITGNAGDGFRALASNEGTIHGNLINNEISSNGGNGAALLIENGGFIDFGTPASNRVISGNSLTSNGGAGIRLVSNVSATTQAQLDAVVRGNTITGNSGGGIVSEQSGPNNTPPAPPLVAQNNVVNLTVGGPLASHRNDLNGNTDVGIGVEVTGNGKAVVDIRNTTISGTTNGPDPGFDGDGIKLVRRDSSLLTATIENVTASGNSGDGLEVDVQGNDRTDPNQPMSGTINTVTWNNNDFSTNGQNGASFRVRGDAQLLADGQGNVVSGNTLNGIRVQTSENSSFGDPTVGLPPGRRTVFDGTTATGNGIDGIHILATEDSRALVEITSTRVAGSSGAHAALNTNGDTSLSNNGRDGLRIETTGGASDIVVTSDTGQTSIIGNGTAGNGGNGIRWDASGPSTGTVRVTRTIIANNIAGATEDTNGDGVVNEDLNGNGVLDVGEDANGNGVLDTAEDTVALDNGRIGVQSNINNGDIDVAEGDGIQFNVDAGVVVDADGDGPGVGIRVPSAAPTPTLVVGGAGPGDGNIIRGNGDDGIAITATGNNFLGVPRPIISIVGNQIGGETDGIPVGNVGDGISLNVFGGTADVSSFGADPANIDFSVPPADGDGLTFSGGVTESGPIVQMSVDNNLISNNNRRGLNLLITGAAGERDREFGGAGFFDPGRISLTNNTIISNGEEGVFFRGDSDMTQGRLTYLANFPFPDPPFNPADDRPQTFGFYTPTQAEFLSSNIGTVNGNTAFSPTAPDGALGYLNLRTVQNTLLTITDNTIQNNGINGVTGAGVYIRVGTGSYVAADFQRNTLGGNLEEDLKTDSFLSTSFVDPVTGNIQSTYGSLDNAGDGTFDVIYWDDSAQFDLRFQNNSGNQIAPTFLGATYTDNDFLKSLALGGFNFNPFVGVRDRDAGFFQVDNGPNLDDPNNTFINFGITQDIDGTFSAGGYNLRGIADPAWPNIGFAPFMP